MAGAANLAENRPVLPRPVSIYMDKQDIQDCRLLKV